MPAYDPVDLHVMTGRVSAPKPFQVRQEQEFIRVYRPEPVISKKSEGKKGEAVLSGEGAHWKTCPVCRKRLHHSMTTLLTKGEQPSLNLVRRQFELQPPNAPFCESAPNMGRKVLLFSHLLQRAARLGHETATRGGNWIVFAKHSFWRYLGTASARRLLWFA